MSDIAVVAVGASLGGLQALQFLLGKLPVDFGAAVAIAQHRQAENDSPLLELLQSASMLPVFEVEDRQPFRMGEVYLAPANYHLLFERDALALSTEAPVAFARPSIDVLFESAADVFGPRAAAVVLTGSSQDGAAGAAAIVTRGGTLVVQDPSSAEAPEAPRAALHRTRRRAGMALEDIPALLVRLCPPRDRDPAVRAGAKDHS
jgi:two-component system chemotaxis response regulator CheB